MKFEKIKEEIYLNKNLTKRLLHLKVYRSDKRLYLIFIFRQFISPIKVSECINLTRKLLSGHFDGKIDCGIKVDKEKKRKILTFLTPPASKEELVLNTINFLSVNLYKEFL